MERSRQNKINSARAKLKKFKQQKYRGQAELTDSNETPALINQSPVRAFNTNSPSNSRQHAATLGKFDEDEDIDEADDLETTLREMEQRYMQIAMRHEEEKRDMRREITALTGQVSNLLVSNAHDDVNNANEMGDNVLAEIGAQLEQAHDYNNELHKMVKAFQTDMERLAFENKMLSEQHSRQLNAVIDLESKLQLQRAASDQALLLSPSKHANEPSSQRQTEQIQAYELELKSAHHRIASLEAELAATQVSLNEKTVESSSLAQQLELHKQATATQQLELHKQATATQNSPFNASPNSEKALHALIRTLEEQLATKDADFEQFRKTVSLNRDASLQTKLADLERTKSKLEQELLEERNTCALLQKEVDSIPEFIEQLHRERQALHLQSKHQQTSSPNSVPGSMLPNLLSSPSILPGQDIKSDAASNSIASTRIESGRLEKKHGPFNVDDTVPPLAKPDSSTAAGLSSASGKMPLSSQQDAESGDSATSSRGLRSLQARDTKDDVAIPQATLDGANIVEHGASAQLGEPKRAIESLEESKVVEKIMDFGPCRNCYGAVYVL